MNEQVNFVCPRGAVITVTTKSGKVTAKIVWNPSLSRSLNQSFPKAQKWLDNEILKDSDPYVPMDTGVLRLSGQLGTVLGSGEIVYNAPYAARQYYRHPGKSTDKHPQACMQWFEKAKAIHKARWVSTTKKMAGGGKK